MKQLLIFIFLVSTSACPKSPQTEEASVDEEFFKRECSNLTRCDAASPCEQEGKGCFKGLCDTGPVCIEAKVACLKKCGVSDCRILTSDPLQVGC